MVGKLCQVIYTFLICSTSSTLLFMLAPGTIAASFSAEDNTNEMIPALSLQPIMFLEGFKEGCQSLGLSPDGKTLAVVSSEDPTITLFEVATGKIRGQFTHGKGGFRCVVFSPDGRKLAIGGADLVLFDIPVRAVGSVLKGHSAGVNTCDFATEGRLLASGSFDKTVRLWNAATGREIANLGSHKGAVFSVKFNGSKILASGGMDGVVKLWDVERRIEYKSIGDNFGVVHSIAFSPDGRTLAYSSVDVENDGIVDPLRLDSPNGIVIWDMKDEKQRHFLKGHRAAIYSLSFSPCGRYLASGSADQTVKIWDTKTGREAASATEHKNAVTSVVFFPDGRKVASASWGGKVIIWKVSGGAATKESSELKPSTSPATTPSEGGEVNSRSRRFGRIWLAMTPKRHIKRFGSWSTNRATQYYSFEKR